MISNISSGPIHPSIHPSDHPFSLYPGPFDDLDFKLSHSHLKDFDELIYYFVCGCLGAGCWGAGVLGCWGAGVLGCWVLECQGAWVGVSVGAGVGNGKVKEKEKERTRKGHVQGKDMERIWKGYGKDMEG